MPRVPTYDQFQATPNTAPQQRVGGPMAEAPGYTPQGRADNPTPEAGKELQRMGQGFQQAGADISAITMDMQQRANQLRVDDAYNQAEEAAHRLRYDKEAGLFSQKGRNALERESGKPLADEYSDRLREQIDGISGTLGNDAQRQAFAQRSRSLRSSFYGQALKHETEQGVAWADSVDTNNLKLRQAEIGEAYNNPQAVREAIDGQFDESGNLVKKGIKQSVESIAQRSGLPDEWIKQETGRQIADAHKEVVLRLMDDDPVVAQAYLNDNAAALGGNVTALQRTLRPAVDRAFGDRKGTAIYQKSGPVSADADNVIDWVIKIEGGYVANDAGKGETNFGINKTANPDIDVKNLTPDQARAIYKERYWNGIGADRLPKEMRAIAFDTAVNQGVSTANRLLAQAQGDPQKMVELRRQEYQKLIEDNPGKYKKYEASWMARLDSLQGLAASGGDRSLGGMLKEAEQIPDREQRNIATSVIKHNFQVDELAAKEAYAANFNKAQDLAYAKPGGWREIAPSTWAGIKPEDREKLRNGLPKHSDTDTLLMLQENPDLWKSGEIEKYRPLLSESDYRNFHSRANGPNAEQKILAAKIDAEQFSNGLLGAGLENLLHAKKGTPEEKARIELKAKYEQVIEAEQQAKKHTLSIDEKNGLLVRLLKPVKVDMVRTGTLFGMFDGPSTPEEMRAYQVKNPRNIQIPNASRTAIEADFAKRGIKVTPDRLLNAYLASEEAK